MKTPTILITYETIEGHTGKIARAIAKQIELAGFTIVLSDVREPGFAVPGQFNAVIICGPIHMGRYPKALARFVSDFSSALNEKPSALVTVSLSAANQDSDDMTEIHQIAYELCQQSGWAPLMRHDAAGALKYLEYNYFKRLAMKSITRRAGGPTDTSQDYEFTDWPALRSFITEFLVSVKK